MKFRYVSFFYKLVLLSLCMGTFPVILLGIFSSFISSNSIQIKVNEANLHIVTQTQTRVEQLLKTVDSLAIQLINSPYVAAVMNESYPIMNIDLISDLNNGTQQIQLYELDIKDVIIYNTEKEWFKNNKGFFKLENLSDKQKLQSYLANQSTSYWAVEEERPAESSVISIVKKIPNNSITPSGIMVVLIEMRKIINLSSHESGFAKMTILNDLNKVVMSSDPNLQRNILDDAHIMKEILDTEQTENLQKQFKSANNIVTFRKSAYNGWSYLSVLPISDMTADSKRITWLTVWICLIILLLSSTLALLWSRKLYSPLRKAYSLIGESQRDGSRKNEVEAITGEISRLISNQHNFKSQLLKQTMQLSELFVRKLFQGQLRTVEIQERMIQYGYNTSWSRWSVLVVQIDQFEKTKYREHDLELIMFAVNNIIGDIIPAQQRLLPVIIDESQVTLFGNFNEELHKNDIYSIAEELQKAVYNYLGLRISIGISRSYSAFNNVSHAYKEGLEALKYRIRLGPKAILFFEDIQLGPDLHHKFPDDLMNELAESVKLIEYEKIGILLDQFISELFKEQRSHSEYQFAFIRLLVVLIRIIEETGKPIEYIYGDKHLFDELFRLKSPQEVNTWFLQSIIQPLTCFLEKRSQNHYRKIANDMVEIIHATYDSDLTLEDCANQLNYHPSYIKRVLKKELNTTFTDYLFVYRLKIAKRMLLETDMKISEIAEQLKYNNAQNFIRFFRKMEGITPGKFREKARSI
jgi:two-component system response regulator YesN